MFLHGLPCSLSAFMWSQDGAAIEEQSMFTAWDAGMAIAPGVTEMAKTTATNRLMKVRNGDCFDRIK